MKLGSLPFLLAGLVFVSAGCSSDGDSNEFGARFCELFAPCCAKAGMSGDQATCRYLYSSVPHTSAADQCLKDYQAQAKDPAFCDFTLPEPESCKQAFPDSSGTKKPGETCDGSSECAGDATCDMDFQTKKGVCAAFVLAAEGAACIGERNGSSSSWSGDPVQNQIALCDYAAGLHCEGDVCKKRAPIGQACTSSHGCLDGAYCESGMCAARLGVGSPCTGSSDQCDDKSHCGQTSKKCEARLADGQACAESDECLSDYCSDGKCKYNPGLAGLALAFVCN